MAPHEGIFLFLRSAHHSYRLTFMSDANKINATCAKCSGKGRIAWTRQDAGKCYDCDGTGVIVTTRTSQDSKDRTAAEYAISRLSDMFHDYGDISATAYESCARDLIAIGNKRIVTAAVKKLASGGGGYFYTGSPLCTAQKTYALETARELFRVARVLRA